MSQSRSGFTLVELMIAIVISAGVFLGIFSVIRAGVNTQMFVREMSDAGRQGPAILSQVSEDLRNAYFYNLADNDFFDGRAVELNGDVRTDQLHFLTTRSSLVLDPDISEADPAHSPITEVSYMLKEGRDGFYELHRREQPLCDDEPFRGGYFRMISDRIVSWRVQYAGWDLSDETTTPFGGGRASEGEGEGEGESARGADPFGAGERGLEGDAPLEEDATLTWEDNWSSKEKRCLPAAVKIEMIISPDVDPQVMRRMRRDDRIEKLDKSYIHICLLPQFREDIATMRETAQWDGRILEPVRQAGGAARGRGGRGDQRGDARGGGGRGDQRGQDGGRGAGNRGGDLNQLLQGGNRGGSQPNQGGGNNPFLDLLRGGNRGR